MALIDDNYKFLYTDVGASGRASDGGVWNKCTLNNGIERNDMNLPAPQNIPFNNRLIPYVIVGDEAFPLKQNSMKHYPVHGQTSEEEIFNYSLSRARRTSENAFGILVARFRVFKHAINTSPKNVRDSTA